MTIHPPPAAGAACVRNPGRRSFACGALAMLGGALPAAADSLAEIRPLSRVLELGRLRVAIRQDSLARGTSPAPTAASALDLTLARLVADGLGVRLDLVPVAPPDRLVVLHQGHADVSFAGLTITEARVRQALFLNPHARIEYGVVSPDAWPLRGVHDLHGRRVGVVTGDDSMTLAETMLPRDITPRPYPDRAARMAALLGGEVDAIIGSRPELTQALARARATGFAYRFTLRVGWMAGAVRFGQHDLLRAINAILFIARTRGDLSAISEHHLGYTLAQPPQI